jgi:hypothetical protein
MGIGVARGSDFLPLLGLLGFSAIRDRCGSGSFQ